MGCERVVHLTSVHPRSDTRIFVKMCSSLVKYDYEVALVVADDLGNEIKNAVQIFDVGAPAKGRLSRMIKTVHQVYDKAVELNASVYHLHDPELIPIGLKLKKIGKIVIFDAHEDLPKQILCKPYLNPVLKLMLSKSLSLYEKMTCGKFDAIVAATPHIREKFARINSISVNVNNFPIMDEMEHEVDWIHKHAEVVYIGAMNEIRGVKEIVKAIGDTNGVKLNLGGKFSELSTENEVKNYSAWFKVNELGFLDRKQVNEVLARSRVGLVTLHPTPNYIDSLPVKMFEYMASGIPVIASDFKLWRDIVEGNNCGICVDPMDTNAISEAIQYLIDNPQEAEVLGANGKKAAEEKYNWQLEEEKLVELYNRLLN